MAIIERDHGQTDAELLALIEAIRYAVNNHSCHHVIHQGMTLNPNRCGFCLLSKRLEERLGQVRT